jgi:hypothetical protein
MTLASSTWENSWKRESHKSMSFADFVVAAHAGLMVNSCRGVSTFDGDGFDDTILMQRWRILPAASLAEREELGTSPRGR